MHENHLLPLAKKIRLFRKKTLKEEKKNEPRGTESGDLQWIPLASPPLNITSVCSPQPDKYLAVLRLKIDKPCNIHLLPSCSLPASSSLWDGHRVQELLGRCHAGRPARETNRDVRPRAVAQSGSASVREERRAPPAPGGHGWARGRDGPTARLCAR